MRLTLKRTFRGKNFIAGKLFHGEVYFCDAVEYLALEVGNYYLTIEPSKRSQIFIHSYDSIDGSCCRRIMPTSGLDLDICVGALNSETMWLDDGDECYFKILDILFEFIIAGENLEFEIIEDYK